MPVGAGPYGLAESGGRVYAMCQYASRIDVLDASTLARVKSIDLAQLSPPIVNGRGIAVTPGGDVYLESDGMLSVLTAP